MIINKELIIKCLSELRKNQIKYKVYKNYYDEKHDILSSYAMSESRSNSKIIVNYFNSFIQNEISYSIGNPINYISTLGDTELINSIDLNFSYWSKIHDQELLRQAAIYGESYECEYISSDGEFKAATYTPLQMFVLESGNAEKDVEIAIHNYKENMFSDVEMLDVYHGNVIDHYKIIDDENIQLIGTDAHIFYKPPIFVCGYNTDRKSMLDGIKSLMDEVNTTISNYSNECSDFRMATLAITGAELIDEADLSKMKKVGAIQIPKGGSVQYLIKNMPDGYMKNLLEELEDKIYRVTSHIDTNQALASNLSGTALMSRMITLTNKCLLMQSMLEQVIKKRLKNFFRYLKITTNKDYDYRTIKLKLVLNVPSDLNLLADTISKLRGLTSDETLLAMLPFVENPQLELEKRRAELEAESSIDLDKPIDEIASQNGLAE